MQNLLNPRWILLVNSLPLLLLFLLFFGQYTIIRSLLTEENIRLWIRFGVVLALLGAGSMLYAWYAARARQTVSPYFGALALLTYIPWLYGYFEFASDIIPFTIPQWMVSGGMELYVGTFLMPTLIYALFVLVVHFTEKGEAQVAWKNFLAAIAVPIAWYLFLQIILPLWQPLDSGFSEHVIVVFLIAGTVAFLFFFIRGVYIFGLKKSQEWHQYQLAWKIPVSIVFPMLGLLINNGYLSRSIHQSATGIFGDFNHVWFYILAVVNGILLCLPNLENRVYRVMLFAGRAAMFAYTLYFFLVFLPYLPLSVMAIVAIGTGFLMLTPLALFVIHVHELSSDWAFLRAYFPPVRLAATTALCALLLPVLVTADYLQDKRVLKETLGYIYSPDYSRQYAIDKRSLQTTLEVVKHHKHDDRGMLFGQGTPFLSAYFNWLVLDNLTLSNPKINYIERVFFGNSSFQMPSADTQNGSVDISALVSSSVFDTSQLVWRSWVDLELTNRSETARMQEYATTIELPTGCWISDYYLYVGDRKEMGILAEKKSALWVYSQILNENRDPGILYYLTGNKVALRVFPFAPKEVRKTGIELIHKEPVTLALDSRSCTLGDSSVQGRVTSMATPDQQVRYVSRSDKAALPLVQRKPSYHFIVDASQGNDTLKNTFVQRIESLRQQQLISADNAQVSFVNTYVSTIPLDDHWAQTFDKQTFEGGFYLDRAIRTTLVNAWKNPTTTYPVLIVVTDKMSNAIIENDFADLQFTYPENGLFYTLNRQGALTPHQLWSNPKLPLPDSTGLAAPRPVRAYPDAQHPTAFLTNNDEPGIVMAHPAISMDVKEAPVKDWQTALLMQGMWNTQVLHPETSGQGWLPLVKSSFGSRILTPVTSFLVVENEAQKAALLRKQAQVLASHKSLDIEDDTRRMSEPGLVLLMALTGLFLWYKNKHR